MSDKAIQAPLKDRMIVYAGVAIVLIFSWLYILGMGWHMNTLPFTDNTTMSMNMSQDSMSMNDNGMEMNKQEMKDMNQESNILIQHPFTEVGKVKVTMELIYHPCLETNLSFLPK